MSTTCAVALIGSIHWSYVARRMKLRKPRSLFGGSLYEDFKENEPIPSRFACDGENICPELHWDDVPEGTRSFDLTMTDPDAPGESRNIIESHPARRSEAYP